jgi:hypothetical protein
MALTDDLQLRTTFSTVTSLISASGFSWDDENSFDVTPEKRSLWEAYVAVSRFAPELRSLLNKFEETCRCKTVREAGVATLHYNGRNCSTEDKGQQCFVLHSKHSVL